MLRAAAVCSLVLALQAQTPLAPTPPMGWNSWDSYAMTVTEFEFKANAQALALNLKPHGWQYTVIDEGWYIKNPEAKAGQFQFVMDTHGRYIPAEDRFPSARNDAGLKPIADYVHSLGLKFGIHIIRGIPREAVKRDLPIADSQFASAEAADKSDTCAWNVDNYGVKYTPAGQAYYDSLARLYARWNLDYIKVDCISAPYKGDEIRMISDALRKSGRAIVLSLSPGPAPLEKAAELRAEANLWRISNDVWDVWTQGPKSSFPQSVLGQFPVAAAWAQYVEANHWPDADMLPIGYLGPRAGYGSARESRLNDAEERTLLTLWAMFRSPLYMGGNLTRLDEKTKALLTNDEWIAVDQHSSGGREAMRDPKKAIWIAKDINGRGRYIALFNLTNGAQAIEYPLQSLGISTSVEVCDVWTRRDLGRADRVKANLAPHEAALFHVY